ncbi:hypothetical protein [Pendulispora albinea]|uniref:Uncharacterized protein n=1 Tax=Pendulispora albinea TaxID=2741071 RepID=A0ABZ2LM68_9BACT
MGARKSASAEARSKSTKKIVAKGGTKRAVKTGTGGKPGRKPDVQDASAKSPRRGPRPPPKSPRPPRPTIASVSEQIKALAGQVEALTQIIARAFTATSEPDAGPRSASDGAGFDSDLLTILAQLDRGGRYAGMVPIPEVRDAFLRRGWTRRNFDHRLLQAERDFVVDLKTADDPSRLADPELAIEEPGRGHLQYVVLR